MAAAVTNLGGQYCQILNRYCMNADIELCIGYAPPGSVVTDTIVPVEGDPSANY